jgi:hypothetical protein
MTRVHLRVESHRLAGECLQPAADDAGRDHEHREEGDGDERHPPLEREHHRQGDGDADEVVDDAPERARQGPLRADHVVVEPGDQRAGLRAREERDRHRVHVAVEHRAQVEDQLLADRSGQPPLDE